MGTQTPVIISKNIIQNFVIKDNTDNCFQFFPESKCMEKYKISVWHQSVI